MNKLLQELISSGEITISLWRVTAKGGPAVLFVFILVLVAILA